MVKPGHPEYITVKITDYLNFCTLLDNGETNLRIKLDPVTLDLIVIDENGLVTKLTTNQATQSLLTNGDLCGTNAVLETDKIRLDSSTISNLRLNFVVDLGEQPQDFSGPFFKGKNWSPFGKAISKSNLSIAPLANDSDLGTVWVNRQGSGPNLEWWGVDFGRTTPIDSAEIVWSIPGHIATTVTVQGSHDLVCWFDIVQDSSVTFGVSGVYSFTFPSSPQFYRAYRFFFNIAVDSLFVTVKEGRFFYADSDSYYTQVASPVTMDGQHVFLSVYHSYIWDNQLPVADFSALLNSTDGHLISIDRSSGLIVCRKKFSQISGFSGDFALMSPVITDKFIIIGSGKICEPTPAYSGNIIKTFPLTGKTAILLDTPIASAFTDGDCITIDSLEYPTGTSPNNIDGEYSTSDVVDTQVSSVIVSSDTGSDTKITTDTPHQLSVGEVVVIEDHSVPGINDCWEVLEVVSAFAFKIDYDNSLFIPGSGGTVTRYSQFTISLPTTTPATEGTGTVVHYDNDTTPGGYVYCLNKQDLSLVWSRGLSDDPWTILRHSPIVVNGKVFIGKGSSQSTLPMQLGNSGKTFRMTDQAAMYCLDLFTGELIWTRSVCPTKLKGGETVPSTVFRPSTSVIKVKYAVKTGEIIDSSFAGSQIVRILLVNGYTVPAYFSSGLLIEPLFTTLPVGYTVMSGDGFAGYLGKATVTLTAGMPVNPALNGVEVLRSRSSGDLMTGNDAYQLNYFGCDLNQIIYSEKYNRIYCTTDSNTWVPYDEQSAINSDPPAWKVSRDLVVLKQNAYDLSPTSSNLAAIRTADQDHITQIKSRKTVALSSRGNQNYHSSVICIIPETGEIEWSDRNIAYNSFQLGEYLDTLSPTSIIDIARYYCKSLTHNAGYAHGPYLMKKATAFQEDLLVGIDRGGFIKILEPRTGSEIRWERVGPPGIFGGSAFNAASSGSNIYYVQLVNPTPGGYSAERWYSKADEADGVTIRKFSSPTGSFVGCYNVNTQQVDWEIGLDQQVVSGVRVVNDLLLVPTLDKLLILDTSDGSQLFEFDSDSTTVVPGTYGNGELFWPTGYIHTSGVSASTSEPSRYLFGFTVNDEN